MNRVDHILQSLFKPALVIVGIGTFLAILGPFGSHDMGWPWVWFYWFGILPIGAMFGWGTGILVKYLQPRWPDWAYVIFIALGISTPLTGVVFSVNSWLAGRLDWDQLPGLFFNVLVISLFVSGIVLVSEILSNKPSGETHSNQPNSALLDKLPVRLRTADILALQSEDHYLRVHTEAGDELILMRLSDAIAACESIEGMRTHRSWWVARSAIQDAHKADGRASLVLKNGLEIPVSRTYYPKLRNVGWI